MARINGKRPPKQPPKPVGAGVDIAHVAAEMYPGDPLRQAQQAAFELSILLAAVLEHDKRTDLVTLCDWQVDENGTYEVRLLTPEEIAELRSEKGQQRSQRYARTVAARANLERE